MGEPGSQVEYWLTYQAVPGECAFTYLFALPEPEEILVCNFMPLALWDFVFLDAFCLPLSAYGILTLDIYSWPG